MPSSHPSASTKPSVPIRILVADRNRMGSQLLAESLARDARFQISDVVAATEILSLAGSLNTDVALIGLDFDSAKRKGLQVARTLSARHADLRIVALLEVSERDSVIAAFRCGATGVFSRTDPLPDLFACIERVSRGEIWAGRSHSQFLLETLRKAPSCEGIDEGKIGLLSQRELQVAEHAAQGQSNKQIGAQLGLSEHTIKNYLFRIFEKLGVSNRFELLFLLFKECNGLLSGRAGVQSGAESGNSIETYLKAAEEGVVAAQFIVGLAHLEGYGVEKNGRSAYYWLRTAEENSGTIRRRSRALAEELRSTVETDEIEAVERSIAIGVQENKFLRSNRAPEFIRPSANSAPPRMPQEFSAGRKSKVVS